MIPPTAPEASREFMQEIGRELGEVRFDRMTRLLYSTDASIYQMMPVGVAFPHDADQVAAAVEIAGRHAVPVLPRGSGSSLDGQAVGHALVLDLTRHMDQVLEIDPEARRRRGVEADGRKRGRHGGPVYCDRGAGASGVAHWASCSDALWPVGPTN